MDKIDTSLLGVAGEFLVVAELCRRGYYAQPTFGNQKRVDLLVFGERADKMVKLEVKSKQGNDWPNCKGICAPNTFLVFVDFKGKPLGEMPSFYILSSAEWRAIVLKVLREYRKKHPDRRAVVGEDNVLVLLDEVNKQGNAYKGVGVKVEMVKDYAAAWDKIGAALM